MFQPLSSVGIRSLLVIGALLLSSVANADTLNGANTAWVLTATALVLFMTLPLSLIHI